VQRDGQLFVIFGRVLLGLQLHVVLEIVVLFVAAHGCRA
jgi:hypothetical protein